MLLQNNTILITPQDASERLGVSKGTLAVWRSTGRYPLKFIKIGKNVMYKIADIDAFIVNNTHIHTAGRA